MIKEVTKYSTTYNNLSLIIMHGYNLVISIVDEIIVMQKALCLILSSIYINF